MQETFKPNLGVLTAEEEAFIINKINNTEVSQFSKNEMLALLETHKKGGLSAPESKAILSDLFTISFE